MEKHLRCEEKTEDGEHGDAEDGLGWVRVWWCSDGVEEQEKQLLNEERDADTVDSAAVDVLVDLAPLVGEVEIVPVHAVLDDEVGETKGGDEGADDGVGDGESEHEQHPGVVDTEGELVDDGSPHTGYLGGGPGWAESHRVHEQLREPHNLQTSPNQSAGGHIVDEECSVVREEDALPVDDVCVCSIHCLLLDELLHQSSHCRLTQGGQDQDHEEQEAEHLPHDPEVLHWPPPVSQPEVWVGNHHWQQCWECPRNLII